jgi:hypothetical protein
MQSAHDRRLKHPPKTARFCPCPRALLAVPTCQRPPVTFAKKCLTPGTMLLAIKKNAPECRRKTNQNLEQVLERLRAERRVKDIAKKARQNGSGTSAPFEPPSASEDVEMNFDDGDHAPQENDSGEPDAIPPLPAPAHAPGSIPQTGSGRNVGERPYRGMVVRHMAWGRQCSKRFGTTRF